jgi:hypothetical protein
MEGYGVEFPTFEGDWITTLFNTLLREGLSLLRAISVATCRKSNGLKPLPEIILLQWVLQQRNLTSFASARWTSLHSRHSGAEV